tara:strand:- start:17316 stop:19127 length:1812 start_codon:yes stop_codon:yes gene_type:complete
MANPLHLKASRTQVLSHIPNKTVGKDGDIVVANIHGKGVYLCIKTGGRWFTASRLSDTTKIDKTAKDIITRNIRIKDIKNSQIDTDKFIVSSLNGELKYRNSEQLLSDLDSDGLAVNYKSAYCSLGQYTNKEECEANNGTWYYSENESHDSISSTAENQLLTLGQSIGGLDSEPTLLYDGSTLEIKRNTDYDDNWQTSAQDTLLKLSYDSTNNITVGISSGGDLTITPSGGDTTLSSSTLTIGTIAEVGSDTDKILMSDSGVVKYVTGANLRSYIGAGTSSFGGALNDLSDVTYSSGDLTISSLDTIVTGTCVWDSSGEISLDHTDRFKFKKAGTEYARFDVDGTSQFTLWEQGGASTSDYFQIACATHGATTIKTVDSSATAAHLTLQLDGDLTLDSALDIELNADGGNILFADATVEIAEFTSGLSNSFYVYSAADTNNKCTINVAGSGVTTFSTTDSDGALGHLNIEPNGHVEFDGCGVGFDLVSPTYNASDTDVDFKTGNKQFVTFGSGNITDLNLFFPATSGNFVILLKQDGTGSRTVTNYKAFDSADNAANGSLIVKFAGGSNPTLTTDANHVDIISIFWDADNEIAYGVPSLDFQF